jgi:hypothetical protein
MKKSFLYLSAVLVLGAASLAHAGNLYTATAQTGSRFNPTGGEAGGRSFDDVFLTTAGGENSLHIDSITFGIRRGPTAGFLVPVDVEFFAAVMGGATGAELGPVTSLGTVSLAGTASAGFVTETVTRTPNLDILLNTGANAGFGGVWLGMTFKGVNASDALNGWRIVNAPTVGASRDSFGLQSDITPFGLFGFAAPTLGNFYLTMDGTLSVVPEPAAASVLLLGVAGLVGRRFLGGRRI